MQPLPTPEFLALQRAVAGRYSLERELGRGGMGIVFLARDVALERPVAIKLLPPTLAEVAGFRDRFLREARTAAQLVHPNIVPIHAVEEGSGLTWFVMEYIPGESLGARLRRAGPLDPDAAVQLLREVAWALGHAHGRGVIHRDIKPDNILLEAGSGRALVTDFGIAHADGAEVSGHAGTPHFVAPEVLQGGAPTVASDLYALGVTAWLALTGRRPFEGSEGVALVAQMTRAEAPPLAAPGIPPRLAAAVDRCVQRDPGARWPEAEALAAELRAVEGTRATLPAPLRRFVADGRALAEQVAFGVTGALAAETGLVVLFGWNDWAGVVFHTLAALLGGFALIRFGEIVAGARELRAQGWGHLAAVAADRAEHLDEPVRLPWHAAPMRDARLILAGGLLKTALAGAIVKWYEGYTIVNLVAAAAMVILPALTVVRLWRFRPPGKPSLWSRFLAGRLGRWVFDWAGIGATRRADAPVPGEPTALALGQALHELFAALPAERQRQLAEVPELAERLQARALAAGPERAQAVVALETLRLDLLRLTAGTITEPELTADLEAVQRLGAEVDRAVEAAAEVANVVRGAV
ncbi:MAG TPA: serine/threonine-protein kinase [Gemmatimonadales bacterium]|nr:serine/threonine-protein kinase [Gemmatimonadales bacterium]